MIGKEFRVGGTAYLVEFDASPGTGLQVKEKKETKILSVGKKYVSVDGSEHRFREIVADFPVKGILECEYTSSRTRSYTVLCSDRGRIADILTWYSHSQFFRGWKERRTLSLCQLAVIRQVLEGDPLHPELENTGVRLLVSTPEGKIHAEIMPDKEYPGIALLVHSREGAQPGAVMECHYPQASLWA